jgi:hypothetical protein
MKKLLSVFVILAAISLIASSAASAQRTFSVANNRMAAELVGGTFDVLANPVSVSFSTVSTAPNTTISLTLANGLWATGTQVSICLTSVLPNTIVGTASTLTVAPQATITVALGAESLASGSTYSIEQGNGCPAVPASLNTITVTHGTPVGASVQLTMNNAAFSDPNVLTQSNIITLFNQFAATLTPGAAVITFPAFNTFIANVPAELTVTSDPTLNQAVTLTPSAACGGVQSVLNAEDSFPIKVSGNLTGLGTIVYSGAAAVTDTISATDVTNGFTTLTIGGANLCVTPLGTPGPHAVTVTAAALAQIPGTPLTATASILGNTTATNTAGDIGAGYARILLPALTPFYSFTFNASSWIIPYLSTDPNLVDFCVVNNEQGAATPAAPVSMNVVTSEGGAVQTGIAIGTLPSLNTALITFSGATVQIAGGAVVPITLPAGVRYSAQLNIEATAGNLSLTCFQKEATGAKRLIPVFPGTTAGPGNPALFLEW